MNCLANLWPFGVICDPHVLFRNQKRKRRRSSKNSSSRKNNDIDTLNSRPCLDSNKSRKGRSLQSLLQASVDPTEECSDTVWSSSRGQHQRGDHLSGHHHHNHTPGVCGVLLCPNPRNCTDIAHLHLGVTPKNKAVGCIRSRSRAMQYAYLSNHVVVNQERKNRGIVPLLRRCSTLDKLAREKAESMAKAGRLLPAYKSETLAENVQRGPSLQLIHQLIMFGVDHQAKEHILDPRFANFGMGTARGKDGLLYMSQLFQCNSNIDEAARGPQLGGVAVGDVPKGRIADTTIQEEPGEDHDSSEEPYDDDSSLSQRSDRSSISCCSWGAAASETSSRDDHDVSMGVSIPSLSRGPSLQRLNLESSDET